MFRSRASIVAIVIAASFGCGGGPAAPTPAAPLTVAVSFPSRSSCSPLPDRPCTVPVIADSSAPAEIVAYQWSGCASGSAREAGCTIDRPGPLTVTIEVRHRDGRTARAAAQLEGLNRSPVISVGNVSPTPNSMEVTLLGLVSDPDEFINNQRSCEASVTGACRPDVHVLHCGEGMFGLEVAVHRTATAGTCTVAITAKDSWDLRTTVETTFDIATLLSR